MLVKLAAVTFVVGVTRASGKLGVGAEVEVLPNYPPGWDEGIYQGDYTGDLRGKKGTIHDADETHFAVTLHEDDTIKFLVAVEHAAECIKLNPAADKQLRIAQEEARVRQMEAEDREKQEMKRMREATKNQSPSRPSKGQVPQDAGSAPAATEPEPKPTPPEVSEAAVQALAEAKAVLADADAKATVPEPPQADPRVVGYSPMAEAHEPVPEAAEASGQVSGSIVPAAHRSPGPKKTIRTLCDSKAVADWIERRHHDKRVIHPLASERWDKYGNPVWVTKEEAEKIKQAQSL